MKSLIVIVIAFASFSALGQAANTNTPKTNNNVTPTTEKNMEAGENVKEASDTTSIEMEVMDKESLNGTANKKIIDKQRKAESLREEDMNRSYGNAPAIDTQAGSSVVLQNQYSNYQKAQVSSSRNAYSRSASPKEQQAMDESVDFLNKVAPGTYQTNLFNYQSQHYNTEYYPYLEKAAEIAPDSLAVRQQLSAYYFTVEEPNKADSVVTEMIQDGTICSGSLTYATNLSWSVGATNTVIVHGFDDLLPLSHVKNETNATYEIVSLDLMQSESYRTNLKEKGYVIPESKVIDTAFLVDFVQANEAKNIQLSMTLPRYYFESFLPNLYPRGLTFVLENESNLDKTNKELWEKKWGKDELKNGTGDMADQWSANYLPVLVALKRQYELSGKTSEAELINQVIVAISERRKLETKTKKYTY